MRWITRARIDRIACPWRIARFVDPAAEFVYVPADRVLEEARRLGATPYDVDGVELSHDGPRCSFDAILRTYRLEERALARLATILRGADTARLDLAPECAGLLAVSLGLSRHFADDHAHLAAGMVLYDARDAWCRKGRHETHSWNPQRDAGAA